MISFLLLTVLAGHVASECVVSEWEPWSAYEQLKYCGSVVTPSSFPVKPAVWDSGRTVMSLTMALKEQAAEEMLACKQDAACSLYTERPTETGPAGHVICEDNMANDIPCLNVDQLSFVNIPDLVTTYSEDDSNPRTADIWGWTDPLLGDEYAIVAMTGGTSFVRITNPNNPVPVAFLRTATTSTTWRDAKTIDNHVYIGAEGRQHGIQVVDLTRLRQLQHLVEIEADAHYTGIGNSHNIVENVESKTIYAVGCTQSAYNGCSGGLHAVDVSNPLTPVFAGCYSEDGYTHDAECVIYHGPDARYFGREVCFNYNEDTITIVDTTDKSDMRMISKVGYNGHAYTHQGWLTADHSVLLCDDENDEIGRTQGHYNTNTYIWDVSNLEQPVLKTMHVSHLESIDHNQYVKDGFTYQANYESGLRIKHIDQMNFRLNEVAYFDVFPSRDTANFGGAWSVYPYFPSGNVVISSIEHGLFTVRPDYASMKSYAASSAIPAYHTESVRHRDILFRQEGDVCPALTQIRSALLPDSSC